MKDVRFTSSKEKEPVVKLFELTWRIIDGEHEYTQRNIWVFKKYDKEFFGNVKVIHRIKINMPRLTFHPIQYPEKKIKN